MLLNVERFNLMCGNSDPAPLSGHVSSSVDACVSRSCTFHAAAQDAVVERRKMILHLKLLFTSRVVAKSRPWVQE